MEIANQVNNIGNTLIVGFFIDNVKFIRIIINDEEPNGSF